MWNNRAGSALLKISRLDAAVEYIKLTDLLRVYREYDLPVNERMLNEIRILALRLDLPANPPGPR